MTTSAPATAASTAARSSTSPWTYLTLALSPCSAGSKGRRAMPTTSATASRGVQRLQRGDPDVARRPRDGHLQPVHLSLLRSFLSSALGRPSPRRRGGRVRRIEHREVLAALDTQVWHVPLQRARQPPVRLAEDDHHGRHEQRPHDGRVDRDRDREPDAELLDGRIAVEDEAREDGDHDQRRRGDHPRGSGQPLDDRVVVVAAPRASAPASASAGTPGSPSRGRRGSRTSAAARRRPRAACDRARSGSDPSPSRRRRRARRRRRRR